MERKQNSLMFNKFNLCAEALILKESWIQLKQVLYSFLSIPVDYITEEKPKPPSNV